jgi:hypothetical protein
VIYLFLRSASATIIASLAVPISLIASCAAMYAFNFSSLHEVQPANHARESQHKLRVPNEQPPLP